MTVGKLFYMDAAAIANEQSPALVRVRDGALRYTAKICNFDQLQLVLKGDFFHFC